MTPEEEADALLVDEVMNADPTKMTPAAANDLCCKFYSRFTGRFVYRRGLDHALHQLTEVANRLVPDDD